MVYPTFQWLPDFEKTGFWIGCRSMFHESQGHFTKELSVSSISSRLGWFGTRRLLPSASSEPAEAVDTSNPSDDIKQEQLPTPPPSPRACSSSAGEMEDKWLCVDNKRSRLKAEMDYQARHPVKKKRKF
ncbi:hypothetical protein CLAFUW4_10756 [Fulvia fulva]|uniref:Uncharacterized protein n=1 Tax=Passalora fulva TaxID=5499 RepID=A0A9Q8LGA3_PASFU|nr:uncharacterized protein CLAFUR5_05369 [Fulvia fulva]KAK4615992.1 hypothetical protein CLAFUR4_10761 [Fulvia fulva]KAK4617095.1 hypothetical protein CLAFUR0_10768 [Fulvia fulva]UJO16886.1 hypothetical protein CLAFUR5_05369 [Fulvia fulva]WPV19223.1 hypothetical protein CLAFUW4_10756 [Fulvia fulva]WPV34264.1 hypothetical protein CLAFUW7_10758 [Fulvia fulva]